MVGEILTLDRFVEHMEQMLLGDWVLVIGEQPCVEGLIVIFEPKDVEFVRVACGALVMSYPFVRRSALKSLFRLDERMGRDADFVRIVVTYPDDGERCTTSFSGHEDRDVVRRGIHEVVTKFLIYECREWNKLAKELSGREG